MDAGRVAMLRELLDGTEWVERTRGFARGIRRSTKEPGGLLVVGTPTEEPWHFAAHLDDEARLSGVPEISPTLVRWQPPAGAPAHLAIGMERLETARRGESLIIVAPDDPTEHLLERVSDARRIGATVFALDVADDTELSSLAHDALVVPPTGLVVPQPGLVVPATTWSARDELADGIDLDDPAVSFDAVEHLVSLAAGEADVTRANGRRGLRDRLARLIDNVSGPDTRER
jgi:hypothetical protein